MVFSSISFLCYFLPTVLFCYFLVSKKWENIVLLLASLFFYFCGEPKYIIVLLASCIINYQTGKVIEKTKEKRKRKRWLILDLVINFGMLFYFKYFHFVIDNINQLFSTNIMIGNIMMPIGISFFTFQGVSYVIDIYRNEVKSAKSLWSFATYLSLFPQLIAGPIVRYETVSNEMENRSENWEERAKGCKRFIIGLAKKVLLANALGALVQTCSEMDAPTTLSVWMETLSVTLQIYFDFSGYSDMAIGLGWIFGFHFLENFDYPLIARSITEFWRRWHISLSTWFRDYVYIPLGGNRCNKWKQRRNITIVFLLTGLWHGANWNYILWGCYFAIILMIEKKFLLPFLKKHRLLSHVYTMILIVIGFIIFFHESLPEIGWYIESFFGGNNLSFLNSETLYFLRNYMGLLIISLVAMTPISQWLTKKKIFMKKGKYLWLENIYYLILLLLSVALIVDSSFQPFLYFRF